MLPIKLITFDVTGTLLFFRTPVIEKYIEVGSKFGIKADPKIVAENFKTGWKTLDKEHPNFGKGSGLDWQEWWGLLIERSFRGYIKPEEKCKVAGIFEDLKCYHTTKKAFKKRPGTDDLLQFLKSKAVRLGIISNYDPRLTQILEVTKLKNYFDFILISYELGYKKPDARIFEEALRRGGCTSGKEAIHVGDDKEADYLGAKAAGLRSVLMSSGGKDTGEIHTRIIESEIFEDFFKLKDTFQKLDFH